MTGCEGDPLNGSYNVTRSVSKVFSRSKLPTTTTTSSFPLKVRVSWAVYLNWSHWDALKMLYPWRPFHRRFAGRPVPLPPPPPPPPGGPGITLRMSRDWVARPFLSVALQRMIDVSQLSFG